MPESITPASAFEATNTGSFVTVFARRGAGNGVFQRPGASRSGSDRNSPRASRAFHRTEEDWLFANLETDRPYHQDTIQQNHIRKAGKDASLGDGIGWHTFRHSYRSWLDDTGAPTIVQQELKRHASIQTTMNVYGKAMTDGKRQAHSKVVELILKSRKTVRSADATDTRRAVGA